MMDLHGPMAMLVGETPRMRDVRRRFVRRGWSVVQACGHVRGIRRRLVLESSSDLVLVVSTHSAVHRRFGRALASMLADRAAFPSLRMTIVLLDEEPASGEIDPDPVAERLRVAAIAAGRPGGEHHPVADSAAFSLPCDLRVPSPEQVVRFAVAEVESPRFGCVRPGDVLVAGDGFGAAGGMQSPDWLGD